MDPALGTLNLPEIDEARKRRNDEVIAALNAQLGQTAADNVAAVAPQSTYGGAGLYGDQLAESQARARKMVQDVADRTMAQQDGRTALATMWMQGIRQAGQDRMDTQASNAQWQWDQAHPQGGGGGGGGGGGSGRGGGRGRSSGGAGGAMAAAMGAPVEDPIQSLARILLAGNRPAPAPYRPQGAPPPARGGTLVRRS